MRNFSFEAFPANYFSGNINYETIFLNLYETYDISKCD